MDGLKKKHVLKALVVFLCLFYGSTSFARETDFFVSAHQDDWQLFMNPNAYNSVKAGSKKTVFINVTAGDAGQGDGGSLNEPYYLSRRGAMLGAIRFMVNTYRGGLGSTMINEDVMINGHAVHRYHYGNTTAYFLVLPDGNPGGTGYYKTGYQSLKFLYEGQNNQIDAVDGSASYDGWDDLVTTLEQLVIWESEGSTAITFHLPDTDTSIQPSDHSDHRHASLLMQDILKDIPCINQNFYLDYMTGGMPDNVSFEDLLVQAGTWGVTTANLGDSRRSTAWNNSHNAWLGKQYYRTVAGQCDGPDPINLAPESIATASSQNTGTTQTANKAIDGVIDGNPSDYTKEWATLGEGEGAWLQLQWNSEIVISSVTLYDRPNLDDYITSASLIFSDGSTVAVPSLNNDGTAVTITLPTEKVSSSLVLQITGTGGATLNIGLSEIEVLGYYPNYTNIAEAATATASSQNTATSQTADKAIDGVIDGNPFDYTKEWASLRESEGAWLHLQWDSNVAVSSIKLYDRPNLVDHITSSVLVFSDGSTLSVPSLNNDGTSVTVKLPAIKVTDSVTLEITEVARGTQNIGLSEVEVIGTAL